MENIYPTLAAQTEGGLKSIRYSKRAALTAPNLFIVEDSPNAFCPLKVWVIPLLDPVAEINKNGTIFLDHQGKFTHAVRKAMNRILPPKIRVILRNGKFYIIDEFGLKNAFESKVVIAQGRVYTL